METLVLDQIRDQILTPKNLSNLAKEVSSELYAASEEYSNDLKVVEKEITDVKHRLEYHYGAIEFGKVLPKDLGKRIHELTESHDKLELRKTVEMPNIEELRQCTKDLKELLTCGSTTERQAFIRGFVKEIKVTGDDAKLTYTMPELPQNQSTGRIDISCIVQYGGRHCTIRRTRTFELGFSLV